MVTIQKENINPGIYTIKDAVCPMCFELLTVPTFLPVNNARYIPEIRRYFGWCFGCKRGFCVIQFKRDGRWVIHKYQAYIQARGNKIEYMPLGTWQILNELPEVPVVLLGPGGDYDRELQLKAANIAKTALDAISKATEALKSLLNPAGEGGG